ncbi:MAG: peptide-N-glycosidase F-related protein [Polyangiales bacterium]
MIRRALTLLCVLVAFACGDDSTLPILDAGQPDVSDAGRDVPVLDAGADVPAPDVPLVPSCEDPSRTLRPFQEGSETLAYGEVAGDFRINEVGGGRFGFAESFSGCDSYVFINHAGDESSTQVFNGFVDQLLEASARNVHYFFTSYENDESVRTPLLETMRTSIDETLARISTDEREHWAPRLHVVAGAVQGIDGSVGAFIRALGSRERAFGIDRGQRFDPVGSLAAVTGAGFVSRLPMAGYVSHYYNYKASLEERIAEEDAAGVATTVLFDETGVTEREHLLNIELPADIGAHQVEVDVQLVCHEGPAECSEWDRIAALFVCHDEACEGSNELVRWITPYSRPGERRWLIDATDRAALLQAGPTTFRLVLGPTWERATPRDVRIALRSHPDSAGATTVLPLFRGGNFDATYNEGRPDVVVTAPASASRAELVVLISGHGQTEGDNCAEWCNHTHHFAINGGADNEVSFPSGIGSPLGCAERAREGVIPGQYGNWAPLRAGWCPGEPVHPHVFDVTDQIVLGEENSVSYEGLLGDAQPRGGNIELSSYLVFYD